jgi:hypothetical protein
VPYSEIPASGPWQKTKWQQTKRFLLILSLGALIWALLLRFFFPGYLDPFVPFHIDHYIYLGDSGQGYGLGRYIRTYPRPLGNVLFDLIGRLGIRGMLAPVFLLTLVNATLLITYLERLTRRTISFLAIGFFLVLVFANPEGYASVKEDILAVVCLFCTLVIFHLWQNYLESGRAGNLAAAIVLAILASYVKETYFATLVLFFVLQAIVAAGAKRRAAVLMAIGNAVIAAISLSYNAHLATFVNPHAGPKDPYYQDWHPLSLLHGLAHMLHWLMLPVPALLVLAAVIALARTRQYRSLVIALISLVFVIVILLPNALLRNHWEDQYAWLGAFFFFAPVLLAEFLLPRGRNMVAATLAGMVIVGSLTLMEDHKDLRGMAGWLREQEELQQNLVATLPIVKSNIKMGEHELVLGITLPFNPFRVPGFVRKYFGPDTAWTVVLPDEYPLHSDLTTEMLHRADLKAAAYDHIFLFDANAHLTRIYGKKDARLLRDCGGGVLP